MTDSGRFSFEVRFGPEAIAHGVVPIPRVVVDYYRHLGVRDREFAWVVHLLAYKWSGDNPFPSRRRLKCAASRDSQKRTARRLRELGLLFTTRKYIGGRMVSLIYDLDSLLENCVRFHQEVEKAARRHMLTSGINPEEATKSQWDLAREAVLDDVAGGFEIVPPEATLERLKRGEYDDVPPPWDEYIDESNALFADLFTGDQQKEPADPDPLPDEVCEPDELESQANSLSTTSKKNWAAPVAAGGSHGPAEAIVDGICKWNGMTGIDSLPEKKRVSQVRHVAGFLEELGNPTVEEARLAWQAWTVKIAWPAVVDPFSNDLQNKLLPLVVAVREGNITVESLRREAGGKGRGTNHAGVDWASYNSEDVVPPPQKGQDQKWWKDIQEELQNRMSRATFNTHFAQATASREDGTVTIYLQTIHHRDITRDRLHRLVEDVVRYKEGDHVQVLLEAKGEQ